MDAELFLNTLFNSKPNGDYILIWEKKDDKKVSHWFDNVQDAINFIKSQGSQCDTYVGCGTSPRKLKSFQRCKAEDISGIPAAWIDVDILDPVHSKSNLPETPEKAREIIDSFPLKPTITVQSGHGYQCWWLFSQFGRILNDKVREEAADLLHKFTWTMRDKARSMGYDLDMTFDLSRVFRVPGTLNHKDDPPVEVKMEECNIAREYGLKEFNQAVDDYRTSLGEKATPIGERRKTQTTSCDTVIGKKFKLDPNAEPPKDKMDTLLEFEPKFKASWEHRRKDFKSGDESASAYDLSLASFATIAGWEEQEIVDMLIAFRRSNNLPAKLVEQYYRRTIIAASSAVKGKEALETLETMLAEDNFNEEATRTKTKELIYQAISIKILRVLRYMTDPFEFKLETEYGSVHLGDVSNLISQSYFRNKLAAVTKYRLPKLKDSTWHNISQALLNITEDVYIGETISAKGRIAHYLYDYLEKKSPLYDVDEAVGLARPFYQHEYLYIYLDSFRQHVYKHCNDIHSAKSLGIMLREYGFQANPVNARPFGKWISRNHYRIEIAKDKIAQQFVNQDLLDTANQKEMDGTDDHEIENLQQEVPLQ